MGRQRAALQVHPVSDIDACAARIRNATDSFGRSFVDYIAEVGAELRRAQELLASHKAGFEKWCKDEFGWSTSQVYRLLHAEETVRLISPIGEVKPTSESQCRELECVPEDDLPEVWTKVCERAAETNKPITAKLIREFTEEYRPAAKPDKKAFDVDARGDRLRDWLRKELDQWPQEDLREAIHWITQIITKEYKA